MKLAQMDQLAVSGTSSLHRATTVTKLWGCAIIFAGLLTVRAPLQLFILLLLLLSLLLLSGLPGHLLLPLACYPAVFSLPFALMRLGQSWLQAILIPSRAVSAALVLLLVLASTPYPRLLAALSRVIPSPLGDGILFIYRLFFVMIGSLEQLQISLRLRGAFTSWRNMPWSIVATLRALGLLFVQTIAAGERMQQVMELRGYQGRPLVDDEPQTVTVPEGGFLCLLALLILGVVTVG